MTTLPHELQQLCLKKFTSIITEEDNMRGINESMFYISTKVNGTVLGEEDGDLASMNILLVGDPKLWLVVNDGYRSNLEKVLHMYVL